MILDRRAALLMVPLGIAAVAGLGFWAMLARMRDVGFDPRGMPTPLIGRRVPPFELPGIIDGGFTSTELASAGGPVLVHFWASWSRLCVADNPVLLDLRKQGVVIWGIAYKDTKADATAFLKRHGNPYVRSARDDPGRVAIDWGVTDVPDSFMVDAQGIVRWHMSGPLTEKIVMQQLLPALGRLSS
jgi:cytochrome c biogenesis protein CcmG/thiol:disulfide interchange protein DsbE